MSNRHDLFDFLEKFVMFFNIQTLEYLSFNSNPKLFKLNNAKISPERNSKTYVNSLFITVNTLFHYWMRTALVVSIGVTKLPIQTF